MTHLGGGSVPAEVLCVGVEAHVVSLALGSGGAERQTVTVPLDFLHLQHTAHSGCPPSSQPAHTSKGTIRASFPTVCDENSLETGKCLCGSAE